MITRRIFTTAALAAPLAYSATEVWHELFDGKSLNGWSPSENKNAWKIIDGTLAADGTRSHLYYSGPVSNADFKNFELEAEVMSSPAANSGVYFHTIYQETNFPIKGFEIQVNNTATGEGTYRERKRTGSLYGIRNVHKQIAQDNQWFKLHALVRGKNVQLRVNGMLVVDYTEPTVAHVPPGLESGRKIDHGTFALQCHDPGSKVRYRSIKVRLLPDNATAPGAITPVNDELFKDIINYGRNNYPLVDYDVQLKGGLKVEALIKQAFHDSFQRGVTISDPKQTQKFIASLKKYPIYTGFRPATRDWTSKMSKQTAIQFDYILGDATTWKTDEIPAILDAEPFDILANAFTTSTTESQAQAILAAMKKNGVALQISERDKQPTAKVAAMAKQQAIKFTFGSGTMDKSPARRYEHAIAVMKEARIQSTEIWAADSLTSKAADRKASAFKS